MNTSYVIKVIHKGREKAFFDYWRRQRRTTDTGEDVAPETLGFEVTQAAGSVDQAIAQVRRKHPGLQIDIESIREMEVNE